MRRSLILLALVVSSVAIAACSETSTAPTRKAPGAANFDCRSGYISSDGRFVCDSTGGTATVKHP